MSRVFGRINRPLFSFVIKNQLHEIIWKRWKMKLNWYVWKYPQEIANCFLFLKDEHKISIGEVYRRYGTSPAMVKHFIRVSLILTLLFFFVGSYRRTSSSNSWTRWSKWFDTRSNNSWNSSFSQKYVRWFCNASLGWCFSLFYCTFFGNVYIRRSTIR